MFTSTHILPYFSVGTIPSHIKYPPPFFPPSVRRGRETMDGTLCVATEKSQKNISIINFYPIKKVKIIKVQNTIKVNQFTYAFSLAALSHSGQTCFVFFLDPHLNCIFYIMNCTFSKQQLYISFLRTLYTV